MDGIQTPVSVVVGAALVTLGVLAWYGASILSAIEALF
jgi:hypothetical protein